MLHIKPYQFCFCLSQGHEDEDMTTPRYGWGEGFYWGKGFYCRYEGELRQGHLEGFRLNQVRRGEEAEERERGRREREREEGKESKSKPTRNQEGTWKPRELVGLYRKKRSLGEGKHSLYWGGLGGEERGAGRSHRCWTLLSWVSLEPDKS